MARRNKLIQEYHHDPYYLKEKINDPAVCRQCGVVYRTGTFEWVEKAPAKAAKISCPACKRIEARYEGGVLYLEGEFLAKHKDEIIERIGKGLMNGTIDLDEFMEDLRKQKKRTKEIVNLANELRKCFDSKL